VFNLNAPEAIARVVDGEAIGTVIAGPAGDEPALSGARS